MAGRNSHQKRLLKTKLFRRSSTCALCRKQLSFNTATIDHIVPQSKGGSWQLRNLRLCCFECNNARGDTFVSSPTKAREVNWWD